MSAEIEYTADDDLDMKKVKRAAAQLAEHFDCVQIFVTSQKGEITRQICRGEGNYSARYGMCREWILTQEAKMRTPPEEE